MWIFGKKQGPFDDEQLNRIWAKWNESNRSNRWEETSNILYNNLFESLIAFAELPGILSPREANKARQKAKGLSDELAKISFFLGLECKSKDPDIGERLEAGGEIPVEAAEGLRKAILPAFEFGKDLVLRQHNPMSSATERDKFINDMKRVLSEQSFKCFEKALK